MGYVIINKDIVDYLEDLSKAKGEAIRMIIQLEKERNWLNGFKESNSLNMASLPYVDDKKCVDALTVSGYVERNNNGSFEIYYREFGYAIERLDEPHHYKIWAWIYSSINEVIEPCGCRVKYYVYKEPKRDYCDKHLPMVVAEALKS